MSSIQTKRNFAVVNNEDYWSVDEESCLRSLLDIYTEDLSPGHIYKGLLVLISLKSLIDLFFWRYNLMDIGLQNLAWIQLEMNWLWYQWNIQDPLYILQEAQPC